MLTREVQKELKEILSKILLIVKSKKIVLKKVNKLFNILFSKTTKFIEKKLKTWKYKNK